MKNIIIYIHTIINGIIGLKMNYFSIIKNKFGYISPSSNIKSPSWGPKQNVFIYENCGINSFSKFICTTGKFIMRRNCSVGPGLTVITFNHKYDMVGYRPEADGWNNLIPNDVIINEDVWIGANVTLCPGTIVGRGSIVAAGSVCTKNNIYPPYSIIGGNPAKFIKFRLSLEDQFTQEQTFYDENNRIEKEILIQNYYNFKK